MVVLSSGTPEMLGTVTRSRVAIRGYIIARTWCPNRRGKTFSSVDKAAWTLPVAGVGRQKAYKVKLTTHSLSHRSNPPTSNLQNFTTMNIKLALFVTTLLAATFGQVNAACCEDSSEVCSCDNTIPSCGKLPTCDPSKLICCSGTNGLCACPKGIQSCPSGAPRCYPP